MNIFILSFGKDSMATLLLAIEQGIPIDRVMYCEIRFNDEISGEHPLMGFRTMWFHMALKLTRRSRRHRQSFRTMWFHMALKSAEK